jgi:cell wall assembly regulator SMI1
MTPLEALRDLESRKLAEQDAFGRKSFPKTMRLLPGMSDAEIDRLEAKLPSPIPAEVRELLRVTRGIEDLLEGIDFADAEGGVECFETLPNFLSLTGDGTGNYWGVDLMPDSLEWGPIYFWCHDAPVVIYQCANLTEFVLAIAEYHTPDRPSFFRDYEEQLWKVWRENPGLIAQPDAARSSDPACEVSPKD